MKANTKYILTVSAVIVLVLVLAYFYRRAGYEGFEGADTFTMYYADWCPHCQTVKPIFSDWSKSGSMTINGKPVNLTMMESSNITDKSIPVKGYPTFLLKKADGSYKEFSGERTPSGWESWLKSNM